MSNKIATNQYAENLGNGKKGNPSLYPASQGRFKPNFTPPQRLITVKDLYETDGPDNSLMVNVTGRSSWHIKDSAIKKYIDIDDNHILTLDPSKVGDYLFPLKDNVLKCVKEEDLEFDEYIEPEPEPHFDLVWRHEGNDFRLSTVSTEEFTKFKNTKYYNDFVGKKVSFRIDYNYSTVWKYRVKEDPNLPDSASDNLAQVPPDAIITTRLGPIARSSEGQEAHNFNNIFPSATKLLYNYDQTFKVKEVPSTVYNKIDPFETAQAIFSNAQGIMESHECYRELIDVIISIHINDAKYSLSNVFTLKFQNATEHDICYKYIFKALINDSTRRIPKTLADNVDDVDISIHLE